GRRPGRLGAGPRPLAGVRAVAPPAPPDAPGRAPGTARAQRPGGGGGRQGFAPPAPRRRTRRGEAGGGGRALGPGPRPPDPRGGRRRPTRPVVGDQPPDRRR